MVNGTLKMLAVGATLALALGSLTACTSVDLAELLEQAQGSSSAPPSASSPTPPQTPTSTAPTPPLSTSAPSRADLVDAARARIDLMPTLPTRPNAGGYERSCSEGTACVFGPAWTDDQDAPLGHNGCDTRNDVLAQQLETLQYRGNSRCVVASGTYTEPYFGTAEEFVRGESQGDQDEIDHVVPLALAWDLGMNVRDIEVRKEIANDAEYNLLLTTRIVNATGNDTNGDGIYDVTLGEHPGKSDMAAHEWLPYLTDTGRACDYAARYVLTLDRYDLPLLEADKTAIAAAFERC